MESFTDKKCIMRPKFHKGSFLAFPYFVLRYLFIMHPPS